MKPSSVTAHPWINVKSCDYDDYEDTGRTGKWMIFGTVKETDKSWAKIELETEDGALGMSSKVATAKASKYAKDPLTRVICVHTYDWGDKSDVENIL